MTCVVGLEHRGRVWLAADTSSNADENSDDDHTPKVFKRDEWVIGYAGSWRLGALVRFKVTLPKRATKANVERIVSCDLIDEIVKVLDGNGFSRELKDEGDAVNPWNLLVGIHGELWEIDQNLNATHSIRGYHAIGEGAPWAQGVVAALKSSKQPESLLKQAIKIAGLHCTGVSGVGPVVHT